MTSLHYAAARGSLAIVKVLVKYKAPLDAQDGAGMAPLHAAVIHDRHLPVAAMLVASGCNVDEADARGYTPLHLAAASGQLSMVRVLVEAGA
ncbi:ankyrin repeat protein, partial [Baffinella frigidus]